MFFMRKSMERGVEGDFQLDGVEQKYWVFLLWYEYENLCSNWKSLSTPWSRDFRIKKHAYNMLFLLIDPSLRRGAWPGAELTDFSNWKNNLDITLLDLDQNDS